MTAMATVCYNITSLLTLRKLKLAPVTHVPLPRSARFLVTMSSGPTMVPSTEPDETSRITDQTFDMYSTATMKRKGKGTAIMWFRNDLRVLDNEALYKAWISSDSVLPVYCIDPRLFSGSTHCFGFPKTGALRAEFVIECLVDLKKNLMKRGLDLLIKHGKPEEVIPSIVRSFWCHTVYAHKETCSEEVSVERSVSKALASIKLHGKSGATESSRLQLVWGSTMHHVDDLPFSTNDIPDVYTQFRRSVECKCVVRGCVKLPMFLGPTPSVEDWGCVPSTGELGFQPAKVSKGMRFLGGESAALGRVHEYIWKKDLLKLYKETRNGMLGPDYSTKFSPWLASGSLSPRFIYEEGSFVRSKDHWGFLALGKSTYQYLNLMDAMVKRYEKEREANDSTYWVLFELIWRDYFRFISIKYGNSIFHLGGPRKVEGRWNQDQRLFKSWTSGSTGYPLIDANMKELAATGFMSNRGRQIVCSFLVRDMGIDWRMGAEWFETCLLDYDPCSNYGNWTYGAGVGNDPREDRYFSIPKQAQTYDPEGEYVAFWLPQLQGLPKEKRNFPGNSYIEAVVPLKHGNYTGKQRHGNSRAFTATRGNFVKKQTQGYKRWNKTEQ